MRVSFELDSLSTYIDNVNLGIHRAVVGCDRFDPRNGDNYSNYLLTLAVIFRNEIYSILIYRTLSQSSF